MINTFEKLYQLACTQGYSVSIDKNNFHVITYNRKKLASFESLKNGDIRIHYPKDSEYEYTTMYGLHDMDKQIKKFVCKHFVNNLSDLIH